MDIQKLDQTYIAGTYAMAMLCTVSNNTDERDENGHRSFFGVRLYIVLQ